MSEAAISESNSTLVDDWSADKQAYHVPWGKAMMWIFLVSDTFIFTCFLTSYLHVRLSNSADFDRDHDLYTDY
jgi:cytochrome c oxidase subunit 3